MGNGRRGWLRSFFALGLVLGLAARAGNARAQGGQGAVTGTVTIAGAFESRVANTVVWVEGIPRKLIPEERWERDSRPRMVQRDLAFHPSVLPVLAGTSVEFPNEDQEFHNVFSASPAHKFDLGVFAKGHSASTTFDQVGIAEINCHVHPRMKGFVVVVPEPYFAAANARGLYKLTGVPLGSYTIKAWNPDFGLTSQRFTIARDGQALDIDFDLRAEQ